MRGARGRERREHARDVARAAQLADQATAGADRGAQVREHRRRLHPVQGRIGEDRVEARRRHPAGVFGPRVREGERGKPAARPFDHRGVGVEPHHRRAGRGDARGQLASAAAEIEDVFARARREAREDRGALGGDEAELAVVGGGVPAHR